MSLIFSNSLILGNGGGSDPSKKGKYVPQWDELPEDSKYDGYIVEYAGESTLGGYTQGYFYKCKSTSIYSATDPVFTPNKISISGTNFINKFFADSMISRNLTESIDNLKSGTMTYDPNATGMWYMVGKNANNEEIFHYHTYQDGDESSFVNYGFVFNGTFDYGEVIEFECNIVKVSEDITWTRIDVQPGGGSGGTTNYLELTNLPKINGATLSGNRLLQEPLIPGANISIENNVISSVIKTYSEFPEDFVNDQTLNDFVISIENSSSRGEGKAFLGYIEGDCLPWSGGGNAECKVEYMADDIAVLTVSSADVAPYHWEYNTASGDNKWKSVVMQVKDLKNFFGDLDDGAIVQYMGETTEDFINGYFYKMINYSWTQVNVQPTIIPEVPTTGHYQLECHDGVLSWVEKA